jgi:hypothetical protein
MRARILGKLWTIQTDARLPDGVYGDCDPPETPRRKIRLRKGMSERRHLEVLIHECLHAADWSKDEQWVGEVSRDIAVILGRMGYRR